MNHSRHLLWTVPLLILITQLPIFLQSNLTPDTVLYDLQAKCLLKGGVLYRDIVEPNLPGVVWVHALVRTCFGESSAALRGFDLVVLTGIGWLLQRLVVHGLPRDANSTVGKPVLVSLLFLFYLSTSEWCHCQRDTWMLLPCLAAMGMRVLACEREGMNVRGESAGSVHQQRIGQQWIGQVLWFGFAEGILWAVGFWLKPFVAIPGLAVLGISCGFLKSPRVRVQSMLAVLAGGLCVGLAGIFWMIQTGCWVHFLEMMTSWNADYFQAGRSRWTLDRYLAHAQRFFPWIILHGPAIAIAGRGLFRAIQNRIPMSARPAHHLAAAVLHAGYLGWLLQAFALQQLFDYIHVPGMMLAIAICVQAALAVCVTTSSAAEAVPTKPSLRNLWVPLTSAFVAVALLTSPTTGWARQRHWYRCLQACAGSPLEPEFKDDIALTPMPRWRELQPVVEKLHELCGDGGSVLAYNGNLIHLYPALQVSPPTRFVYVDVLARCFPRRRPEMLTAIENSHVQYVVSDLIEDGWMNELETNAMLPTPLSLQASSLFFPYNQKPVFRSGGYVIFEVARPVGCLTHEYSPLSRWAELKTDGLVKGFVSRQ